MVVVTLRTRPLLQAASRFSSPLRFAGTMAARRHPTVIDADAPLSLVRGNATGDAQEAATLSVLSYNVLLPNSVDGWWIYKYYDHDAPAMVSSWEHRQKLLRDCILQADADVVCLQEVAPDSFETDFAFMCEAGYRHQLLNKGRMRNATFWRSDRLQLASAFSKDRTLATRLTLLPECGSACRASDGRDVALSQEPAAPRDALEVVVVNCHLSAGRSAPRRLRQMHEVLEAIRKQDAKAAAGAAKGKKAGGSRPCQNAQGPSASAAARIIVCGDFNSQGATGVRELLVSGKVEPDFRESGDPTERDQATTPLTSKTKGTTVGLFSDCYSDAAAEGVPPPPTLVCKMLDCHMINLETGEPTEHFKAQIGRMFAKFSGDGAVMSRADVERWLVCVNKTLGRGAEYRAAEAVLQAQEQAGAAAGLTAAQLLAIYMEEVTAGKFWGVEHDLGACNGAGVHVPRSVPFKARFDYIYHTFGTLRCLAVRSPLTAVQRQLLFEERSTSIPNSWHPSDHLPVAAVFALVP